MASQPIRMRHHSPIASRIASMQQRQIHGHKYRYPARAKRWWANRTADQKEGVRQKRALRYRAQRPRELFLMARARAKRDGLPFTILFTDISWPTHCPLLGIELRYTHQSSRPLPGSPSIDKIIPSLGYVPGNVQIISYRANRIKCDATAEELIRIGEALRAIQCR